MRLCGIIIALVSGMLGQFSYCAAAPRLEIKLASPVPQWILGESVIVSEAWQCLGDAPLTVVPLTSRNSRFARVRIIGPVRNDCQAERRLVEEGAIIGRFTPMKASQVERGQINLRDWGVVDCGHYEVWVEYDATSARKDFYEAGLSSFKAESNRLQFDIVPPKGIDAEVMSQHSTPCHQVALTNEELLQRFPTSTYAGYLVYQASGAKGLAASDPAYVAQSIAEGSFLNSGSVPDDTGKCKDGWQSLTVDGLIKWREKWFGIVLKNHPDIWFADELRLKLAVDQVALKNCQVGAADLEALSKQAKPEVAEKAKQYLSLVKQKGWIKE